MMRQYHAAKRKFPHAVVFFRMGDFFELFFEDAKLASKLLGLTLTSRSKERDLPMAGVPVRAMDGYLARLVRAGHTVAICDQVKDPKECKGIVDREVVRVVTPGTLIEDDHLEGDRPLFVLAVHFEWAKGSNEPQLGLAWADISTGTFRCTQSTLDKLGEDLARIGPAEVVLPEFPDEPNADMRAALKSVETLCRHEDVPLSLRPSWSFDARTGRRDVKEHLGVQTLEAFGLEDQPAALGACGALLDYLKETQKVALGNLRDLDVHQPAQHLVLDRATRRTLELTRNQQDGSREGTLLSVLDRTASPMGARLLREWLLEPLVDHARITLRHESVAELHSDAACRRKLVETLDGIGDLERLCGKVAAGRATARDLSGLARALERVPELRAALSGAQSDALCALTGRLNAHSGLADRIRKTLADDPPVALREGGLVREGFNDEIDELRSLAKGGKDHLLSMQQREIERTGIQSLKIGFNKVFGYYLEVSHANTAAVPEDYIRKQTLKNAERYITPELKEYEAKVLNAEERLYELEYEVFLALRNAVDAEIGGLLATAAALAELDVLVSLATVAVDRRYVRPELIDAGDEAQVLDVKEGRHPVVEAADLGDPFVPNDSRLDAGSHLAVLTGPNMSGKSTYLRQVALMVILAQMGSFVPADAARLGIVDRVFTRVGSGDDISRGASTFMVEMVETANILRNASRRSLLVLDEVGRGTSTFDGLAIAWAVCEHVHDRIGARCLFATHYHQLTDLASNLERARNLNVAVREWGDEIVFLHRIEEGGTDRSYGIHVARLAGVPPPVLDRAREVLARVERDEQGLSRKILSTHVAAVPAPAGDGAAAVADAPAAAPAEPSVVQRSLFDLLAEAAGDPELLDELQALDLNALSPIEAWQWLERVKRSVDNAPESA